MFTRLDHHDGEVNPIEILSITGWTHQKLAEALDVSVSSVNKWSARKRNPSGRIRRQAAKLMDNIKREVANA